MTRLVEAIHDFSEHLKLHVKVLKLFAFAKIIGHLIEMFNSLSTVSLDHCALRLTFIVVGVSLTRPLYCSLSRGCYRAGRLLNIYTCTYCVHM